MFNYNNIIMANLSSVTHINSRIVDYCAMRNIAGFLAIGVAVLSTGCCNNYIAHPGLLVWRSRVRFRSGSAIFTLSSGLQGTVSCEVMH
jgi:hypothetical protein